MFLGHFLVFELPTGSLKGPFPKSQLNPILKSLPLFSSSSNTSSIDPSVSFLALSVQDISTHGRQFAETFETSFQSLISFLHLYYDVRVFRSIKYRRF